MGEVWGFLWIMLALKIPLAMLLYIVWYAVNAHPEPVAGDDDGGIGDRDGGPDRPRRGPRRRGPHGDTLLPPPPRTRTPAAARDAARGAQR
ncbi:MAG TPA: hypothetical protein VF587_02875 [Solirubrobacteraceae bacterium]